MVANHVTLVVRVNTYLSQFWADPSSESAEEGTKLPETGIESSHFCRLFCYSFIYSDFYN